MSPFLACLVLAVLMFLSMRGTAIAGWVPDWLYGIALGSAMVAAGLNVYGWFLAVAGLLGSIFRGLLHLIGGIA